MSVDRVATSQQSAYLLSQINRAAAAVTTTTDQIASGKIATTYAGFGNQTQTLQATLSANARNDAYSTATTLATTQADMQDAQLTSLSGLAAQLQTAISGAVAGNTPSTLMSQVSSIFEQATAILNSKDANGGYIYGGGKTDTPPVTVSSLSDLVALPSVADAFDNGHDKKAVQVGDGQTVTYGLAASDIATGLMQSLKDIAAFDAGGSGDFANSANLSDAQNTFLSGQIGTTGAMANTLNNVTAQNGYAYNALQNAATRQGDMSTLYSGFLQKIQDTDIATAATQLSLNQTALQAALQVTSTLNHLSLLNYMPGGS